MKRTALPPKYRLYRPKNLAVVRIDGRDHYLGPYDSPASREAYHRLIAEHFAAPRTTPVAPTGVGAGRPDFSINELLNAYRQFAERYYRRDDKATKELADMKYAARPLRALYGSTLVRDFGPLSLKAVREYMIATEKLSRGVTNSRINRIKRIFKWGVSEELVPSSIFEGLRAVDGLRFGRSNARETDPVKPVPWAFVEPVLEQVSPPVAAMIRLQDLTAMRPCEVVQMRAAEIDMTGDVWLYEPLDHKNRWRGHQRLIPLGPQAQALIRPFLKLSTEAFLFSPLEAEAEQPAPSCEACDAPHAVATGPASEGEAEARQTRPVRCRRLPACNRVRDQESQQIAAGGSAVAEMVSPAAASRPRYGSSETVRS